MCLRCDALEKENGELRAKLARFRSHLSIALHEIDAYTPEPFSDMKLRWEKDGRCAQAIQYPQMGTSYLCRRDKGHDGPCAMVPV